MIITKVKVESKVESETEQPRRRDKCITLISIGRHDWKVVILASYNVIDTELNKLISQRQQTMRDIIKKLCSILSLLDIYRDHH